MRSLRVVHRASRALSLAMRAAPAAGPKMVPLSVLEAAREDFKLAREDFRSVREDFRSVREDAKAEAARVREDAKAQAARDALISDARVDEAKARADALTASMKVLEQLYAGQLAEALFERDLARGKVTARALVEEAAAEFWRAYERLDAEERKRVCPSVTKVPFSTSEQLKQLLTFPGVAAYLQVVEEDNGLARGVLAHSAGIMYHALCTPLHARPAGAQVAQLPARVSSASGENGRIAFAALVAFSGRNVGKYHPYGVTVPVVLRVKPVQGLSATLEHIRGCAKLPAVGASVELGVAGGGAGPAGEEGAV